MDQRVSLLTERLDVIADLLAVLKDQLSHGHGEKLEWIGKSSLTYLSALGTNEMCSHCTHRSGNSRRCCKYCCGSICWRLGVSPLHFRSLALGLLTLRHGVPVFVGKALGNYIETLARYRKLVAGTRRKEKGFGYLDLMDQYCI